MAIMNSKIALLPTNPKPDIKGRPFKTGKGIGKFSSIIQGLTNPVQKRPLHIPTGPPQNRLPLKKEYTFYLESLRKGLLVKGKQLDKISLKGEDLILLKEFLFHCGFSKESVERFLKDLAGKNPGKEINLSQFFTRVAELGLSEKRINKPFTLEDADIPHIESALRYFGLTPKEGDNAISAARTEDGGLDLDKLVMELREIRDQINERSQVIIDQKTLSQISKKLENIGIRIPDMGRGGQISIKDFIRALEALTGGMNKENQLPSEVKASIDRILEKAVVASEKEGPLSLSSSSPKSGPHHPSSEGNIGNEGGPVEEDGPQPKVRAYSDLDPAKGLKGENNKDLNPAQGLKRGAKDSSLGRGINRETRNLDPAQGLKGEKRDLDLGQGLKREAKDLNLVQGPNKVNKEGGHSLKSETRTTDMTPNTTGSTFSEAINTMKETQRPLRNLLPTYLLDQVGRQIARSILRGEKVLRFQLKPPDLGFMKVEMDIKDNVLRLGMITENSTVKDMLLSHVHELREALVQQGVKLEKVDIQIHYDFGQSLAHSKGGLKEGRGRGQDIKGSPFPGDVDTEDPQTVARMMARGDHLLDLVA